MTMPNINFAHCLPMLMVVKPNIYYQGCVSSETFNTIYNYSIYYHFKALVGGGFKSLRSTPVIHNIYL